jgi:hypothetical protein
MNKKWLVVPIIALLLTLYWVGSVYAQDNEGYLLDDGYPVDDGYPIDPSPEGDTQKPAQKPKQNPTENPVTAFWGGTSPELYVSLQLSNAFCDGSRIHPGLLGLSDKFNLSYDEVLGYSCEYRAGVGEISLALQTVVRMNGAVSAEEILELRKIEKLSWDEIWQRLGLVSSIS